MKKRRQREHATWSYDRFPRFGKNPNFDRKVAHLSKRLYLIRLISRLLSGPIYYLQSLRNMLLPHYRVPFDLNLRLYKNRIVQTYLRLTVVNVQFGFVRTRIFVARFWPATRPVICLRNRDGLRQYCFRACRYSRISRVSSSISFGLLSTITSRYFTFPSTFQHVFRIV